ncbi:hypothetical protein CDL15_Pgr019590 [Punica granatum]|uniref:Uncharacterized protein n=1 Tax=Punica granatum TaxID=22663 RepID=A0A218X6L6_PUNGR|nr:hypothetical protein CDL15_Pgr019590 [Punica granatum]
MGHGSSKETNSTPSSRTSRFRNWLCHPHRHLMHRLSRHGSSGSSVNTFAEDFAGIALLTLRSVTAFTFWNGFDTRTHS